MASKSIYRVVIRHVTGAKANQIEQFPLVEKTELSLGRDPASDISFDPVRDDVVSRRHATIKIVDGDQISFLLVDNNSSNGTFLNGERFTGEKELLPQDTISLGANGPKLIFDVQPRPASLGVRTRVIDVPGEAATRTVDLGATTKAATPPPGANTWTGATLGVNTTQSTPGAETRSTGDAETRSPPPPAPRSGIGRETLMREIQQERSRLSQTWVMTLAGLAVFAAGIGGLLYWRETRDQRAAQAEIQRIRDEAAARENKNERDVEATESALKGRIGVSAQQIVQDYGNATARLNIEWRLYDKQTGKPVFHQTSAYKNETLRDYVRVVVDKETKIVPWLTLDDSARTNVQIGGNIGGTGFVVEEHGYLLTAKHLAEGWTEPFDDGQNDATRYGWLWEYKSGPNAKKSKPQRIDLNQADYREARSWSPNDGGFVFTPGVAYTYGPGKAPDATKNDHRIFEGRNDKFEVRFPNTITSVNASFVRASDETDAALLKIDTPQKLKAVILAREPAEGDPPIVSVGATVFVLGFPAIAEKTYMNKEQIQKGGWKNLTEEVPKPFISEGIVSLVAPRLTSNNLVTTRGEYGELLQLSINSTGAGNSGGPVFNSEGKVVGVFTSRITGGGATNSGAVPIRFGQELLRFQRE
jgi:serine protease Do